MRGLVIFLSCLAPCSLVCAQMDPGRIKERLGKMRARVLGATTPPGTVLADDHALACRAKPRSYRPEGRDETALSRARPGDLPAAQLNQKAAIPCDPARGILPDRRATPPKAYATQHCCYEFGAGDQIKQGPMRTHNLLSFPGAWSKILPAWLQILRLKNLHGLS